MRFVGYILSVVLGVMAAAACAPARYVLDVEMRHPSKAGVDLTGKNVTVVYGQEGVYPDDLFLESMADAASSVVRYFEGRAAYINVMKNMSVDCDCCDVAEDPCMQDIGVLASFDPVAIDKACLDLVYSSDDPGRDHLIERIESRNGILTVNASAALGVGSLEYELIEI